MRFAIVLSALLAVAVADAGSGYTPSLYPAEPYPVDLNPNSRVVNGQNAARGQFEYQISIQRRLIISFSHICGGSIIGANWILTAAHCVHNGNPANFRIVAGILLLNDANIPGQQAIDVAAIISHPGYPGGNRVAPDDVAVLRLARSLIFTGNVRPISLPRANAVFLGTALLSGWGLTRTGGSTPNHLQFAAVPILPNEQCRNTLNSIVQSTTPFDLELNICTGIVRGGESACSGDSGGPLVQDDQVVGIVSWGLTPCGAANAPSVFGRVSKYIDWIAVQTNGEVRP